MIRNYNIEWYPTTDGVEFKRSTFIRLSKPTGRTEYDAKVALNIFTSSFGNLKKNTIIHIKEMDEIYGIQTYEVPCKKKNIRIDEEESIYATKQA